MQDIGSEIKLCKSMLARLTGKQNRPTLSPHSLFVTFDILCYIRDILVEFFFFFSKVVIHSGF